MAKNGATSKKRSLKAKNANSAGSNAGRGFRYQDAIATWLAVEIWAGRRLPASVFPEGGDDIELRGDKTTYVQVKSRREHLGDYTNGVTTTYIQELWERCQGSSPQPDLLELYLERNVSGLTPQQGGSVGCAITGPIATRLAEISEYGELSPKTSITICAAPQEESINLIVEKLKCSPIAAQICFAGLLARVGELADINGQRRPNYVGLSISDTEVSLRDYLSAVDIESIDRAILEGVCEPVDFLTPLNDSNFYHGVDVEPGHIAAGLVTERPQSRSNLVKGLEVRRAALIVGPSGAGKSALMWETASALRHSVRWFRIRRLDIADIPAIRQLIRTFRASEGSPIGFVVDDVGRNNPDSWGALLKEVMSVPGIVMLGSTREEDVSLIAERARIVEVRADPEDGLAERLWRELFVAGNTEWAGWIEPWRQSGGLLLEYVHILTRGRRMRDLMSDQVAARISDPARSIELDVLRTIAWAGVASVEIDASRLAQILLVSEADLARALQRLIDEHLILSPAPGTLAGLHQLRSEELLHLTHQLAIPTLQSSFERTVASVPVEALDSLIANTLQEHRLPVASVLSCAIARVQIEPDARTLASVLIGLGSGHISVGLDEWLKSSEALLLPKTQIETAAMFGIAGTDLSCLNILRDVQAAADRLSQIKESQEDDPRLLLIASLDPSTLSVLIETADIQNLDKILCALIGIALTAPMHSALKRSPTAILHANVIETASVLGTLAVLDRDIAVQWVADIGQEKLFLKIMSEIAWAEEVSTENTEDGRIVRCDYWYVADSVQKNTNDEVVNLCKLLFALCPTADIAISNAITASRELAGIAEMPLATKRIPRANLPPTVITDWNNRWIVRLSSRVASPSYSDYLSRGIVILNELLPTLETYFDKAFRGKQAHESISQKLNRLNAATEALTPPVASSLEAFGFGSEESSRAVTKFQNLLHCASVNLIKRFASLPASAGAYIAWLSDLISDADTILSEEPWHLISTRPPPALDHLKSFLERLRLLAGESHERNEHPIVTWLNIAKGARSNNALRQVWSSAEAASDKRLARRKSEIRQAAKAAAIDAEFYFRKNKECALPWPPIDVLALVSSTDIVEAVIALGEQIELLQSWVGPSTRLTIMPCLHSIGVPKLAQSGYQTLFPDAQGAIEWAENLELKFTPSAMATLFGEVLALSGELGSMDRLALGTKWRPKLEIKCRRTLETSLNEKKETLIKQTALVELETRTEIFNLVEQLRAGDIDSATCGQAAFDGRSSDITEKVSMLVLFLIEYELQSLLDTKTTC